MRRSWAGFAFDSISEDEDTARLLGINVPKFKLFAFVVGTAGAGLAGALYAHKSDLSGQIVLDLLSLFSACDGDCWRNWFNLGVILAAAFLSALPQFFQVIDDYKLLVYGLLLFGAMRFAPEGIDGLLKKFVWRRPVK